MSTRRAQQVPEVEEFDLAEDVPAAGEPHGASQEPRPRDRQGRLPASRRARATPWVAAAVVLVVVGAAAASPLPLVLGRGQGPDIGLLTVDLIDAPEIAWRVDVDRASLSEVAGDRVLLTTFDETAQEVVALDLATGAETWRYRDEGFSCQLGSTVTCVEDPGEDAAVVVAIDTTDGTQTRTPHPEAVAAIAVDGGTVVVDPGESGAEEGVTLLDPAGREVWRAAVDAGDLEQSPFTVWLDVVDDTVQLGYSGDSLDLATGEPVPWDFTWDLGGGVTIQQDSSGGGVLHLPEGDLALEPGHVLTQFDDDVGGPVLLTQTGRGQVSAQIRSTDTVLWTHDAADAWVVARLQGVVVLADHRSDATGLAAVDEVTGESLWTVPGQPWVSAASTDTLVHFPATGGFTGVDVRTGQTRWELPLDTSYGHLLPLPDGALVTSDTQVLRLTWPAGSAG